MLFSSNRMVPFLVTYELLFIDSVIPHLDASSSMLFALMRIAIPDCLGSIVSTAAYSNDISEWNLNDVSCASAPGIVKLTVMSLYEIVDLYFLKKESPSMISFGHSLSTIAFSCIVLLPNCIGSFVIPCALTPLLSPILTVILVLLMVRFRSRAVFADMKMSPAPESSSASTRFLLVPTGIIMVGSWSCLIVFNTVDVCWIASTFFLAFWIAFMSSALCMNVSVVLMFCSSSCDLCSSSPWLCLHGYVCLCVVVVSRLLLFVVSSKSFIAFCSSISLDCSSIICDISACGSLLITVINAL